MDSDPLESFVAVAEHGSFSAAARKLGRTQSAISQTIARLERRFEQPLFTRGRGGAAVTDAGRILLEHARKARNELDAARRRLAALEPLEDGRLVIGTSDTLGYYFLPATLAAFRQRYPRVEVRLRASPSPATAALVARREVDLGVVSLPIPASLRIAGQPLSQLVRIEPLATHEDVLVVPPQHPLAGHSRIALSELANEDLLLLGPDTAGRQTLDQGFERSGIVPRVVMEMNSVELLKRMVELGFGAAVLPLMAVTHEVQQGHLAAVPIAHADGSRQGAHHDRRQIGMVLPDDDFLPQAARVFVNMLRS